LVFHHCLLYRVAYDAKHLPLQGLLLDAAREDQVACFAPLNSLDYCWYGDAELQ
jgi:hypothetical protein